MKKLVGCELPRRKMMNKLLTILMCFAVYTGIAQSQDAGNYTGNNKFDKPEHDLSKEILTRDDLIQYQKRAIQKVEEFYQYLEAIANAEHKDAVRDKAVQMAERQFEETAEVVSAGSKQKIHDYLTACRAKNRFKVATELKMNDGFLLSLTRGYYGKVTVTYVLKNSKKPKMKSKTYSEEITVTLKKKVKNFGTIKRAVWEVYLGEIQAQE